MELIIQQMRTYKCDINNCHNFGLDLESKKHSNLERLHWYTKWG